MPLLRRYALLLLLLAMLGAVAYGAYAALSRHAPYSLAHIDIAETPAAQAKGLGGRADIPADYGMLFIFPTTGEYAFWMKDMLVPIDIIWLSDTGTIIGVEPSVAPSTYPEAFRPPAPVRYVLETKAGNAAAHGWKAGTALRLPLLP